MATGWSSGRLPDWLEEAHDDAKELGAEYGWDDAKDGEPKLEGDELREFAISQLDHVFDSIADNLMQNRRPGQLGDWDEWMVEVFCEAYRESYDNYEQQEGDNA